MNITKSILLGGALLLVSSAFAQKSITIKGSDTMLILNQQWAEAYGRETGASINVTGGGSSIGINALINGTCDFGASSREMKKTEIDKAKSRGVAVWEIPVALDGVAFAVNAENPIKALSLEQLRKIYIGQYTNWKQVGGNDLPIVVFSRDSNSGTYGFVQQNVLKNQNWGQGVRFLASTSDEVREVSRTPGGIAYGGVAYFKGKSKTRILAVAPKGGTTAVSPTEENVRSKAYPVWRYLYFYSNDAPKGELLKFVNWTLSAEGQKIVEKVGYYSLKR